jgi:hypothetical protein
MKIRFPGIGKQMSPVFSDRALSSPLGPVNNLAPATCLRGFAVALFVWLVPAVRSRSESLCRQARRAVVVSFYRTPTGERASWRMQVRTIYASSPQRVA